VIAVVLSVILFNIGIQLAKDGCLDAGGRIREAGLDRICELGGGGTMPMNIAPATPLASYLPAFVPQAKSWQGDPPPRREPESIVACAHVTAASARWTASRCERPG
jgi:hypothetical protein